MTGLAKISARAVKVLKRCKPVAKVAAKVSKNKPEILAVGGGIAILAAFGWAIYEAVTMKDVLDETSNDVKAVEADYEAAKTGLTEGSEALRSVDNEYRKKIAVAKGKAVLRVSKKLAGPTVLLFVGLAGGAKGIKILRMRNIFLGTAVKGLQESYKFYRNNVREDLGEEADFKYAHGIVGEKTIERVEEDKNGNEIKTSYKVPIVKNEPNNPWRFEFSETWFNTYQENSDLNLFYLKCQQDWWNHELNNPDRSQHVSIYDVLTGLRFKFEVMKAGMTKKQYVDWMYFIRNTGWWVGSNGDGFIDFGLYRAINEAAIKRESDVVFIEFNCDGPFADEWHQN